MRILRIFLFSLLLHNYSFANDFSAQGVVCSDGDDTLKSVETVESFNWRELRKTTLNFDNNQSFSDYSRLIIDKVIDLQDKTPNQILKEKLSDLGRAIQVYLSGNDNEVRIGNVLFVSDEISMLQTNKVIFQMKEGCKISTILSQPLKSLSFKEDPEFVINGKLLKALSSNDLKIIFLKSLLSFYFSPEKASYLAVKLNMVDLKQINLETYSEIIQSIIRGEQ